MGIWKNQSNHWNEQEKVLFPYLTKKKQDHGLPDDQKSLLIYIDIRCEGFRGQITMNIKEFDGENDCVICYVFNNTTQYFQLLDLLSELCNNLFKRVFELWYANEVKKQLEESLWNKCSIEMIDIETYPRTLASRFVWASNK